MCGLDYVEGTTPLYCAHSAVCWWIMMYKNNSDKFLIPYLYGSREKRSREEISANVCSFSTLPLINQSLLIQILIVCSSQPPPTSFIHLLQSSLHYYSTVLCCSIIQSFQGPRCPDRYQARPHNTRAASGWTERSYLQRQRNERGKQKSRVVLKKLILQGEMEDTVQQVKVKYRLKLLPQGQY